MTVRVRFAPSPTGFLHVGGARTALFNWLVARQGDGSFILRSDDTDQARSDAEFYEDILAGLTWLGLAWDEGVTKGGPHAPYRQSQRLKRYKEAVDGLVERGAAYPCFCTPEELEERRRAAREEGKPAGYDGRCRTIDSSVAAERRQSGEEASIRFAVPRPGETLFTDAVRDEVRFDHEHVDDFVIIRSDGTPTYHLASSVDDVDYGITHVIRGEDLLSSTPKHILLGEALGQQEPIAYAHLPLLRGPDGRKLSKRHGETSLRAYREAGYVPEAMVNYLALLGWSPGGDETVVALDEMIERFDLAAVSKNPAVFDADKLEWLNGVYIRSLPPDEFVSRTIGLVQAELGRELGEDDLEMFSRLSPLVQERVKLLTEVAGQVRFLYADQLEYDEKSWQRVMTAPEARSAVQGALARLGDLGEWDHESIEETLRNMLDELGLSARKGLQPVRVATTGSAVSPPLFESLDVLGRERTLVRLEEAFARM